jgi:hypothetical protein
VHECIPQPAGQQPPPPELEEPTPELEVLPPELDELPPELLDELPPELEPDELPPDPDDEEASGRRSPIVTKGPLQPAAVDANTPTAARTDVERDTKLRMKGAP